MSNVFFLSVLFLISEEIILNIPSVLFDSIDGYNASR